MRLRSITKHLKEQNWTAVGIDLVIVVVGVFIGIQVSNWNTEREEENRIAGQLVRFKSELVQRQAAIDKQRNYLKTRIEDASSLRNRLLASDETLTDQEIYRLAMSAVRFNGLDVSFRGFEELSVAGAISRIQSPALLDALYRWDATLSNLRSTENDVLELRNLQDLPAIRATLSLGNMAQADVRYSDMPVAERFTIDRERLQSNRDFDNALISRAVLEQQNLEALLSFEKATHDLIAAIDAHR
ncbi:MAG: hypothetical protein AAAFM81_02310 [Pseudomonadota bacterium]